jgi:hypothetical protein
MTLPWVHRRRPSLSAGYEMALAGAQGFKFYHQSEATISHYGQNPVPMLQ